VVGREGHEVILRNYEGKQFRYPDPLPIGVSESKPARKAAARNGAKAAAAVKVIRTARAAKTEKRTR